MFNSKQSGKLGAPDGLSARALNASNVAAQNAQAAAQSAAQAAAQAAQVAAQTAAARVTPVAQTAAHGMGQGMRRGVYSARGWAAPQLEHAADYCTDTVAPRVSDMLRSTARQVRPEDAKRGKPFFRSALSMSVFAIATLAAAGAVAALVRRQYKAAMEADTESDVMDIEDRDEPGTAKPAPPAQAGSPDGSLTDTGTGSGTRGRKSTSGW